jgi:hypothetical protein
MRFSTRWKPALMVAATFWIARAALAESILPVYTDAFENGFEDRLWLSHSPSNTAPVHSGAYSISVTPMGLWQGLYVHHPGLDTTPYTSLSFWANGGIGGQRLQIQAWLGDTNPAPDVYYRVTLATNTWQQVSVPLAALGVANRSDLTGIWIQLTPHGQSNTFFLDDMQFNADPATPAATASSAAIPPRRVTDPWTVAAWCVVGALGLISALLAWLVLMLRRSGLGGSMALVPVSASGWAHAGSTAEDTPLLTAETLRLALEPSSDPQLQALRERVAAELAEFARQSLVQGLYSQRGKLMETQQKALAEVAELEARLALLQLPLQERIRAYESRIGELEKELETRDEEMRQMIQATLQLVRDRLELEKAQEPAGARFN